LDGTWYKVVLLLHILCAIIGFGTVFLNGLYGREAKQRPGPGGAAITAANYNVSKIAEYFIYAVFVFGFALVGMSDKAWKFGQTWVWLAIVLYLVGIAVSHVVLLPAARRMRDLSAELATAGPPPAGATGPPPQVAEMQQLGKRLGASSTFLHLLLVVILVLMIWKPGA
jgi:uncharacterized membrane protein